MKFTLLTYDCILAHNAGYIYPTNAVNFISVLEKLVYDFAIESGVKDTNIFFENVVYSDWCYGCTIIYAKVEPCWIPTKYTDIIGKSYNPKVHPNLEQDFRSWIYGRWRFINPENEYYENIRHHKLYRSQLIH